MKRHAIRWTAVTVALLMATTACGSGDDSHRAVEEPVAGAANPGSPAAAAPAREPGGSASAPAANPTDPTTPAPTSAARTASPAAPARGPKEAPTSAAPAAPAGGTATKPASSPTPVPAGGAPAVPTPGPGPTTAPPAAGAPAGGGKSEIVIGSVGTFSGPLGTFMKEVTRGISVWTQAVNARGGVNGHPVRYVTADDGGDASRYNTLVRQLREKEGAIAFVYNTVGLVGQGTMKYFHDNRIPLIGHESGQDFMYQDPFIFTPYPAGSAYAYAMVGALSEVAVPAGKTKLATVACTDFSLCDIFDRVWNSDEARALGFQTVYRARASLAAPDYTAECLAARQAGAEAFLVGFDNNGVQRMAASCARQGLRPIYGTADQLALPSMAKAEELQGSVVATRQAPWPSAETPALKALHDAFKVFAPKVELNGAHSSGWVAAKTFEAAARNLPDKPTSEDVLNGLWAINGDDLGGLTYPLRFPRNEGSPVRKCYGVVIIKNKGFATGPGGSTLHCR